ncbi:MAG: PTS fructose transporter subunit IIA [Candidatus Omnitrophica bacterium CG_4_9_14_0_2_um_filter_42_8]|nr:MAG: PTS fructose transporter subunit IIA [Candidatus Omnitrophica bacterium CG22_combo_CG10-13_8_21_14_all_43_16]PJC48688.1 MAG: PTS fructose transporter subunit IIA [Candidatus Omnitrophica bacterium CG_4_9_14_0_2_um_filter_42_8]
MRMVDFLNEKAISADLKSKDKNSAIKELTDLLVKSGQLKPRDKDAVVKVLLNREALGSTGIGQGVAIPHGKCEYVSELIGAFGISKSGIKFDSLDGEPAYIFFLLLAPIESSGPHLKALARISKLLKDKYFRDLLKGADSEKSLIKIIKDEDTRRT